MNVNLKTDIFLDKLKEDSADYKHLDTDRYSPEEKKNVIRSLMNIRMPRELSKELLSIQDSYLQEELAEKGIVTLADVPSIKEQYGSLQPHADKISLWQGDITRLKVGPIVYGKLNDALRRDLRNCLRNSNRIFKHPR